MKDLSLQIKGLIAKASSSEKPNNDKKKSPAKATAALPKTDGDERDGCKSHDGSG